MGANDAELNIKGDVAALLSGMEKVNQSIGKLDRAMAKSGKASETAARQGTTAWNSMVITVRKAVTAMVGVGGLLAALRLVTKEYDNIKQAKDAIDAGSLSMGALSQFKNSAQLTSAAKTTFREGGAGSLDAAAAQIYQLQSGGFISEPGARSFASQLYGTDDPTMLARAAGTLRSNLGVEETGTFRQLVSKSFAGAEEVTGANPSDILAASAVSAKSADILGFSDEEVIAATSVSAQQAKSADQGGTNTAAYLTRLKALGFADKYKGSSLLDMSKMIQSKGMSVEKLKNYLGDVMATRGYEAVIDPMYESRLAYVSAANTGDLGGAAIARRESDPYLFNERRERASAAETIMDRETTAIQQSRANRVKEEITQEGLAAGDTGFSMGAKTAIMSSAQKLGATSEQMRPISKLPGQIKDMFGTAFNPIRNITRPGDSFDNSKEIARTLLEILGVLKQPKTQNEVYLEKVEEDRISRNTPQFNPMMFTYVEPTIPGNNPVTGRPWSAPISISNDNEAVGG